MADNSDTSIGATAFALFALQQELDLTDIAAGSERGEFVSAEAHSPEWFAAAATSGASLLETAPELQITESGAESPVIKAAGLDLVRMYAPELAALENETPDVSVGNEKAKKGQPQGEDYSPGIHSDNKSVHIGLLKELEDFDN
jgi:hypothetical protein